MNHRTIHTIILTEEINVKQTFKTKLAHMLDNGDKIEFESFVEADSHDAAFETAQSRFSDVVRALSQRGSIEIDKSKIELGVNKH